MKIYKILLFTLIFSFTVNAETVKVAALKGPTGLSMINLIDSNTKLADKETEYSIVNTPQLVTAGLLSGNYDIAALPTNLAAIINNKKTGYTLISVTGEGTLYVVSSDSSIKEWKDLKGKKVYNIARSSSPDFLFSNLLTQNGIDTENDLDIDFTYNHVELAPMLIAGKAETGILPEPLVTSVLLKNHEMKVVLDFQKEYRKFNNSSYPLSCVVAKTSLIKSNPEVIDSFLKELEASINWVKQNPKEAGDKGNKAGLGVTGALISKSIERLNIGYKSAKDSKDELLSYYNILFSSNPKSIGGKMPTDDFFYNK